MARGTSDIALREKRDRDIVERFNHYYHVKRFRYDYVLEILKWEYFFVSESFLQKTIRKMGCDAPKVFKVTNSETMNGMTPFQARNKKMRDRFKQLFSEKQMRMDDALSLLSREFYLPKETIDQILAEYNHYKAAENQTELKFEDL